jgi:AraC-like DNA-binding protein
MQKVQEFLPEIDKVYLMERDSLIHILSGNGSIQVDFKNYFDWREKAFFLKKGQYIKFFSTDFHVIRIDFYNAALAKNKEYRVLFKHLVSIGYVDLNINKSILQNHIKNTNGSNSILTSFKKAWYLQNPFNASMEEYNLLFDVKDIIDQEYTNSLNPSDLSDFIKNRGYSPHSIINRKLGLSLKKLITLKKLSESLKEVAFTDRNIQEIAYLLGYNDDAYFNRIFKNFTGLTPRKFRENFNYENRDSFSQDIMNLILRYHTTERSLSFYAKKMHLSVKALSTKVQSKMHVSLGQLIRLEMMKTAKLMLAENESVATISCQLGFEEANHFSNFFKHYSGTTPTRFRQKKYNS